MAFVKNDVGRWAWVSSPDEKPSLFFATKDEAAAIYRPLKVVAKPNETKDGCMILTKECAPWD